MQMAECTWPSGTNSGCYGTFRGRLEPIDNILLLYLLICSSFCACDTNVLRSTLLIRTNDNGYQPVGDGKHVSPHAIHDNVFDTLARTGLFVHKADRVIAHNQFRSVFMTIGIQRDICLFTDNLRRYTAVRCVQAGTTTDIHRLCVCA